MNTLTSMNFSGNRVFKGTVCTFTLLEFQPNLTVSVRDLLQRRCGVGVQCLGVGIMFHRNRVTRPQGVSILSCLSFSNPRHRIRGVTRTSTNFCPKIKLPKAERCPCVKFNGFQISSILCTKPLTVIFLEIRMWRFHRWWQNHIWQTSRHFRYRW